jgi:hypothetical protein
MAQSDGNQAVLALGVHQGSAATSSRAQGDLDRAVLSYQRAERLLLHHELSWTPYHGHLLRRKAQAPASYRHQVVVS